jgi:hypothetical protein
MTILQLAFLISVNVIGINYVMGKGVRTPGWESKNVNAFIKLVQPDKEMSKYLADKGGSPLMLMILRPKGNLA